ncbi:shikimate dehydrogenase [Bogoriella caseilytica]|uniref:Shikimate dehydrogenase n=1 Tax=Bogoriella caseilytica TaxID=56055 RepID=A0A3N2B930_9MICO|nr:shikimate dehydrogenase [Bogoriella caseilytica]ROR71708.1 shikimate dehydrogenase [Bogoriella caseilytica]
MSTRQAAVLGSPVAHSLSPLLHSVAYRCLGLEGWSYGYRETTAAELPAVVAELDASWAGLSLTMPLKQAVQPLLDVIDPLAEVTGAVNTLVVTPGRDGRAGTLSGFNTDVEGIVTALREVAPAGWQPGSATILGARATASSALAALGELGVTDAQLLARSIGGPGSALLAAHQMGLSPRHRPWRDPAAGASAVLERGLPDVVISTVPAGATDELAEQLDDRLGAEGSLAGSILLDVVYHPWPTPLVELWQRRGGTVAPGWAMLLHQAVAQVRLFTGRAPGAADVDAMRTALTAELAERSRSAS